MLHLPVLDPSTPAEARSLTMEAFQISEESKLPVLLRVTTRVAHCSGAVPLGPVRRRKALGFKRDKSRLVPIPAHARKLRVEIKARLATARRWSERLFEREGTGRFAILAAGVPAATTADLLQELGLRDRVVLARLPCVHPLPEDQIAALLGEVDELLVVEELSPFVEDRVRALAAERSLGVVIHGKRSGHLPEEFEYTPDVIQRGLHSATGLGSLPPVLPESVAPPARPPVLCPACPHRSTFFAAKAVFGDEHLYFNDIGCYTLGFAPPLDCGDVVLSMGAGFSLASGAAQITGERTVGFLGDSTFFHAGMPPLLDAIKQDANIVAVVMDNEVTAMTGFQESPGMERGIGQPRRVSIPGVARALGARHVEAFDPMNLPEAVAAFQRARDAEGVAVLVAQSPCPVHQEKAVGAPMYEGTYQVDPMLCRACGRSGCGMDCGQPVMESTERNMVRSRSLELGREGEAGSPAVAPCAEQCPLGLCVQGYASHVAAGEYAAALELIMSGNALPESVCRVCHRPCEQACVRADGAVAVNDLKRFVMDWAARQPEPPYRPTREAEHGRSVGIVGAGPAGLSAAYELRLRGYDVTLYEREERAGGMLRLGIPAFRLPADALERDIQRIWDMGVTFEGGMALGSTITLSGLLAGGHDAVFLSIGAHRPSLLELAHDEEGPSPGLVDALTFLSGEAGLAKGKDVVVVGGGNAGIDVARTALLAGAASVTVIEREPGLTALKHEIDCAVQEGVIVFPGLEPIALTGGAEPGVRCVETGPETPKVDRVLPAGLVVTAVGQAVDTGLLRADDLELKLTSWGGVEVDALTCQSSHPRVFAGGDVVPGRRTVTDAMAWGQRAAWGIDRALRGEAAADTRPPPPKPGAWPVPTLANLAVVRKDEVHRLTPPELRPKDRNLQREVVGVFSEEQARTEARRCMLCGGCATCRACLDTFGCPAFFVRDGEIRIDPGLCVGCGVCADFCPNGAISRSPEPAQ
ncbi:MAG: FAD-dependent oxidoreductase [Deltaproteobacteria bacterium]|nr:FAD-dependent oxidoreductase [Deltaproteobacteria bacterium]